jgi:hypothetical protein
MFKYYQEIISGKKFMDFQGTAPIFKEFDLLFFQIQYWSFKAHEPDTL